MNYHKQAIRILSNIADSHWREIAYKIAENNPKIFVDAVITVQPTIMKESASWQAEVRSAYNSSGKIAAIKLCRSLTGLDLKGAKEAVEALYTSNIWGIKWRQSLMIELMA